MNRVRWLRQSPVRFRRCLLALALLPGLVHAWWNEEWPYRKEVRIDASAQGANLTEPQPEFPVLLRLHTGNFSHFFDVKEDVGDLRLIAGDDQTPLKFHVETFDHINEIALLWVKVPQVVAGGSEPLYLYLGNPAATKAEDPGGSFDAQEVLHLHFGAEGNPRDSTAYANHPSLFTGERISAAMIGAGVRFDGDQSLTVPNAPSLTLASTPGATFSAWLKPEAFAAVGDALSAPAERLIFQAAGGGARLALLQTPTGLVGSLTPAVGAEVRTTPAAVTPGTWQHVALVLDGAALNLFVDGSRAASAAAPSVSIPAVVQLGGAQGMVGYSGAMDEVGIAKVARSAGWLALAAAQQGSADPLVKYGPDEARESGGGGHGGHFGVIFQAVFGTEEAVVEQAVIIICGLMAAGAALVMFLKGLSLVRARRATTGFLKAFDSLGGSEAAYGMDALLNRGKRFGDSPLYRVYEVALKEVNRRTAPSVGAQFAGLDHKAMETVRAAMDAQMVREGQRLNSQMVLLTIAISGGPFIGLFGTVVGVMVTFAAIAAVGDVNISAIAPGMAAALLATVAGLGVAIPALFGYNYLGSRIKEITADMRVYADELAARLNEVYGV